MSCGCVVSRCRLRTNGFRRVAESPFGFGNWAKKVSLTVVFEQLAARRAASVEAVDRPLLANYGISLRGDLAILDDDVELLRAEKIRDQLSDGTREWLNRLCVRAHVDSTNSVLMRAGLQRSIDGEVLLAEAQTAGRGRRGREWVSPFGRNIAMSLGVRIDRPLREIGAVGLAVGVGVIDALAELGVADARLKWPNDVLLDRRKLCGILIELPVAKEPACVVIGIGINVGGTPAVSPQVGQAVADVTEQVPNASRNRMAGMVIDAVYNVCRQFEAYGFSRMQATYDRLHQCHGEAVCLIAGTEEITGTVAGVGPEGALRLRTGSGIRSFVGGEVSLRQ